MKIICDSAADLPKDYLKEMEILSLPLGVHIDGKNFEDSVTITSQEVLEEMRNGKVPKTSQVSPHHFHEAFEKYAKANESVLYLAFSSELSGTYQAAVLSLNQVKEDYPDFDCDIIDTKGASLGVGLIVQAVAELSKIGKSKQEIIENINFYRNHMEYLFTVDNLEFLARGGRISKSSAFVGGLLNIKPILHIENGKIVPLEKIRGKKKLINRLLEIMEERGESLASQTIGISHTDDEETAILLKEKIQEKFGTTSFVINPIGSGIGSHTGPGCVALFFLNKTQL